MTVKMLRFFLPRQAREQPIVAIVVWGRPGAGAAAVDETDEEIACNAMKTGQSTISGTFCQK